MSKFAAVLKTDPRLADFLNDPSVKKPVSSRPLVDWMIVTDLG